jgi:hypothetical protein
MNLGFEWVLTLIGLVAIVGLISLGVKFKRVGDGFILALLSVMLIPIALGIRRHFRSEPIFDTPGDFVLHMNVVSDRRFEGTGHGVKLVFECLGAGGCPRLNLTDYRAAEARDVNVGDEPLLIVRREAKDKAGPGCPSCETRVYKIVSESR